jgi:hypothetical protein
MPTALNINKLYRNQEERIQDEMQQAKADALRKNLLGGGFQTMLANQGQVPAQTMPAAAGNPFAKLFGGLKAQAPVSGGGMTPSGPNQMAALMS